MTVKIEDVEEKILLLNDFLCEVKNPNKKEKILKLFNDIGENFFISPASSNINYHNAYDGGLFDHCCNVFLNLKLLNLHFNDGKFTDEEMFVVSFLHDIGKASDVSTKEPYYLPVEEAWRKKNGTYYEFNNKNGYLTTRDRTMYILYLYEIPLSFAEYQAILINDGIYNEGNKTYSSNECDLAFFLHRADHIATWQERRENKAKIDSNS